MRMLENGAMGERVDSLYLGIQWEPNVPTAALVANDRGRTRLALHPHLDDNDKRLVVLVWDSCWSAAMTPPNDEALAGHRLYEKGLEDGLSIGEVKDSEYIASLEAMNRVHERHDPDSYAHLRHFVVPLKARTVEVVAKSMPIVERSAR
jgi:hypothetical protein